MSRSFFTTLNYASVNEDWRAEAEALRLGAEDTVLCITGSGARALDLLAVAPARIVAIDANPAQSHLLALKVTALRELTFDDYTRFLGLYPADPRWRTDRLRDLARTLDAGAAAFWWRNTRAVARGLLYEGRWERFYKKMGPLARALRPGAIEALFAFDDLAAQRAYIDGVWDTRAWRAVFQVLGSGLVARVFFGDPAFHRPAAVPRGSYLYDRLRASLRRHLARENFMVSLALRGCLTPHDLPPHLTPAGAATIRGRLHHLEARTGDVRTFVAESDPGAFTRFSLSDVPSFLDEAGFDALVAGVSRAGADGARFCIREFLVRHPWPRAAAATLQRETELEARLAATDRSFAYDFIVGEVRHAA